VDRRLPLPYTPAPSLTRTGPSLNRIGVAALAALLATTAPLAGQGPDAGHGTRFGVSFGGISTIGLLVEVFDDSRSVEIAVGTWSFRDLSVSAVAKQYFGAGAAQPYVGAGLWTVLSFPPEERTGVALVLRAPIGVDWGVADDHSLGAALNVNRALAVRRSDPDDDAPLEGRLVPLPEVWYRFTR